MVLGKGDKKIDLSVVVPFFNERNNLPRLQQELAYTLRQTKLNCEVVLVDDGSTDSYSQSLTKSLGKNDKDIPIKLVVLRRNYGQTAATAAGIDQAKGSLICLIDADLQNDPNDILTMLKKITEGYDAVIGWRKRRRDNKSRSLISQIANYLIKKIFNLPYHDLGCSLKIIKKDILKELHLYGESHRILPLMLYWYGASISEIVVNHRRRISGKSKYGYSRIIKLIIDIMTIKFLNSYGTKPAYIFGTIGIFSNFFGILLLIWVSYDKFFRGIYVHNNPLFLIASFLILLGIQFLLMGLIAELLVRTYFETQRKTTYEIKKVNHL